jgi:cytidyltransferase-like protein
MIKTAHKLSQQLNRHSIRAIVSCGWALGRIREGRPIHGDIDMDFLIADDVTEAEIASGGFTVTTKDRHGTPYYRVHLDSTDQWIDLYPADALRTFTKNKSAYVECLWESYFVAPIMGYSFLWSNMEIKFLQTDYYGEKGVDHPIDHFEETLRKQPVRLKAKRVVFDGVFDPLHEGHIDFIRRIKEHFGESECLLNVAVISDKWATKYKHKPMLPEATRLAVVSALGDVDHAFIADSPIAFDGWDEYVVSDEYQDSCGNASWVVGRATTFLPRSKFEVSSTSLKL